MNSVINNYVGDFLDNSFSDIECGSDDSIFGDSTSESDMSEFGHMNIISDSALFDSYFSIENILGTDESLPSHDKVFKAPEICPSSPFDTKNFPTSVNDISQWLDLDPINLDLPQSESFLKTIPDANKIDVCFKITVPVHNITEENMEECGDVNKNYSCFNPTVPDGNDKVEIKETLKEEIKETLKVEIKEEEEEISVDDDYPMPSKRKRIQNRKYSTTDSESDEEWAPEESLSKYMKIKSTLSKRRFKTDPSRRGRPVPQRRAPGTKQKITQWIVALLRDPRYNPKVITWLDEKQGMFQIKDTAAYARMWGKVKHNQKMTYEKLSRAMRYSYKNDELQMVPELRLTYRFGPNMMDFNAKDRQDPNFEKIHKIK